MSLEEKLGADRGLFSRNKKGVAFQKEGGPLCCESLYSGEQKGPSRGVKNAFWTRIKASLKGGDFS